METLTVENLTQEAFGIAFQTMRSGLLAHAARITNDQEAEDLTQETALIALCILDSFDASTGRTGLYRWLTCICANLARSRRQKEALRNDRLLPHTQMTAVIDSEYDTNASAYEYRSAAEDRDRLAMLEQTAICRLNKRRREVWKLWREENTQEEIANAMGLARSTIRHHIKYIIDELRARDGDLIDPRNDGYASAEAMFRDVCRVTVYRAPKPTGSALSVAKLRRLK